MTDLKPDPSIQKYVSMLPYASPRQQTVVKALLEHGSQAKAAKALGIGKRNVNRTLARLQRAATAAGAGEHFLSPQPLPDGLTTRGTSTLVGADGAPILQWIKSKADQEISPQELLDLFGAEVAAFKPVKPAKISSLQSKDLLVAFIMPEPHVGMLAWAEECGDDYDVRIAQELVAAGVRHLVSAVGPQAQYLLLDGGDYYHYSSRIPVTEKNRNQLSADGRWQKVIQTGIAIYIDAIDTLAAQCRKLDVVRVPGNHDPDWSLWLDNCLHHAYAKTKHVTVDVQPRKAKQYSWGRTMLAVDHGEVKLREFCEFASAEWPEAWGRARYRYVWTGHVHHKVVEEYRGVTAESINSIAARDDFHTEKKYCSLRSMQAVVYHRQYGEVARHTFRPDMVPV